MQKLYYVFALIVGLALMLRIHSKEFVEPFISHEQSAEPEATE